MTPQPDKNRAPLPKTQSEKRKQKKSRRVTDYEEVEREKEERKQQEAAMKKKRAERRQRAQNAAVTVESPEDNESVRKLKGMCYLFYSSVYWLIPGFLADNERLRAQLNAAERQLDRNTDKTSTPAPVVPRPTQMAQVTMEEIRRHLGLEGNEKKPEWLNLRVRTSLCPY